MNQQTVLESKRILAIIDELLGDLHMMQYIPAYLSQFHPADLQALGPDVQQRLGDQYELERKLEKGQGAGNEELMFAHKNATRSTCDLLRGHGYAVPDGVIPATDRDDSITRFAAVIQTFRGLMNDKFNTTVEEDLLKFEILRDTVSREQTASADVKALNREFQSEKTLRKMEVARRDQAIQKLTEEHQNVQDNAVEDAKEFDRLTKEEELRMKQMYEKQEEDLVANVKNLEEQLAKAEAVNQGEEAQLRQERRRREQFLDGLLNQYDTEMTEKTDDLDTLQSDHKRDQMKLEELEKELKVFDEAAATRAEEERTENDRKLHLMDILVRMETSAKLVQAYWRGYAVRVMMMKKKKSGKRKRKKKGKKNRYRR